MITLEEEVKKCRKIISLCFGTQILIYSVILVGFYLYTKNELEKVNKPFVDRSVQIQVQLQTQIDEVSDYLEKSSRQFQKEYEERGKERTQLLRDEGQRFLNTLKSNFDRYLEQSEECFERLRAIERRLPSIQQRITDLENHSTQLEKEVQDIIRPSP